MSIKAQQIKAQQGIGMLEVLVALLLLSIAVLGFSAMQLRAIKATDETLVRSDAMVIIRNISEDLRLYPTLDQKQAYINAIKGAASTVNCATAACSNVDQLNYNVAQMKKLAQDSGIKLNADFCPGSTSALALRRVCLVAAWGDTNAAIGGSNACATAQGTYNPGANCLIVEAY